MTVAKLWAGPTLDQPTGPLGHTRTVAPPSRVKPSTPLHPGRRPRDGLTADRRARRAAAPARRDHGGNIPLSRLWVRSRSCLHRLPHLPSRRHGPPLPPPLPVPPPAAHRRIHQLTPKPRIQTLRATPPVRALSGRLHLLLPPQRLPPQ
jgi:hypothetical protein